jgi:RNase adapter protein RapZ
MQLILISGLSGSGKSIALNVLEDSGYYCVDNLPANLLPELVESLAKAGYLRVGLSVDVRSGATLSELPGHLRELKLRGVDARLLFLDAQTETLVKRFSETRRRHPLSDDRFTLPECIARERELLAEVGALGDHVDTSELSPNTLRAWIKEFFSVDRSRLTLLFESFGYKNGIPLDADLVFDVRCLPNPHYDPVMRPLTGKDEVVVEFLESDAEVQRMHTEIRQFVEGWLPCFIRDNRSYLTVALGCTGGQHRSVYFAEKLARYFKDHYQVLVRHRELR